MIFIGFLNHYNHEIKQNFKTELYIEESPYNIYTLRDKYGLLGQAEFGSPISVKGDIILVIDDTSLIDIERVSSNSIIVKQLSFLTTTKTRQCYKSV